MAVSVRSTVGSFANPGFRHEKTEVVDLTSAFAEKHRDMPASATERELSTRRMNFLAHKVEHNLFLPPSWIIARRPDGTLVRMNGNHTANVIANLNGTFPPGMKVIVSTFTVDSDEAEALLFRQIDARQSGRSPADVAGAYQGLHNDLHETARKNAKLAVEGYVWFKRRIERSAAPRGDDRYELMESPEVRSFVRMVDGILTSKTKEMRRDPIVAAMFSSWASNDVAATTFWQEVALGTYDEDDKEPAHVLSNWLLSEYDEPTGVSPDEFYQGANYAWNQHRADKEISSIKYGVRNGRFTPTAE